MGDAFRYCPWCAAPQRLKLVEFFRGRASEEDKALRVSRYLHDELDERHVRFSIWSDARVEAAVSLEDDEAERLGRPPMDWGAWLTRVAVNACRDRRRAGGWMRFRLRSTHIDDLPLVADTLAPSEAAVSEDTRRRIWVAFRALPRRQQEVFALRYIEEQPTTDVAVALGLSAGSVKRHLYRAVRHLRRALGDAR